MTMTELTTDDSLKPSFSGTLPPNSAVIGYATEEEVHVSVHLSTEMVPVSFMLQEVSFKTFKKEKKKKAYSKETESLRMNHTFKILSHQFKTQVTKSQVCPVHGYNIKNQSSVDLSMHNSMFWYVPNQFSFYSSV